MVGGETSGSSSSYDNISVVRIRVLPSSKLFYHLVAKPVINLVTGRLDFVLFCNWHQVYFGRS